jgi:UDP-glucose 4-epimerase
VVDDRLIVITGAAGHVGGRLLKNLCTTTQHHVRPHFRSTRALPDWLARCSPTFGDLQDSSTRKQVLSDADVVVHLATRGYSTSQPPSLDELNDEFATTAAMVREAANHKVSRFVFVSSVHVLGDALIDEVADSTTPLPVTDYGRLRLQIEHEVLMRSRASQMTGIVLRMSNTFGAPAIARPATWDLLVHDLCRQAVMSNRLLLHTNGTGYRNLLALGDAVGAITRIALQDLPTGTYLLAGPRTFQLRELVEIVKIRAEHVLKKTLTVEVNQADMSSHHPFTIKTLALEELGVSLNDSFVEELDELLHLAQVEFQRNSL